MGGRLSTAGDRRLILIEVRVPARRPGLRICLLLGGWSRITSGTAKLNFEEARERHISELRPGHHPGPIVMDRAVS